MDKYGHWRGGILHGGVANSPINKSCYVHIKHSGPGSYHKSLKWSTNGGPDATRLKAEQIHREKAHELGAVSNQWRLMVDTETRIEYGEMQLTHGFICKIDLVDLPLLQSLRWYQVRPTRSAVNYAANGRHGRMHTFLTGWKLVDHINHDGLDNRRCNLMDATHRSNTLNARFVPRTKSGFVGVYEWQKPSGRVYFYARWHDQHGKQRTKTFYVAEADEHGREKALAQAIAHRRTMARDVGQLEYIQGPATVANDPNKMLA